MKIKDIIKKVNKSKEFQSDVEISYMAEEMNINTYFGWKEQNRLVSYYIGNWHCTDTCVGYKVYFFDDEPVAIGVQIGRKMSEKIEWFSKELYKKVKEYVLTFVEEQEDNVELADLEEEIGNTYKIDYHSQLFEYQKNIALFQGSKVKIIEFHKGQGHNEKKQYEPSLVKIQFEDMSTDWKELKELDFPFNVTN